MINVQPTRGRASRYRLAAAFGLSLVALASALRVLLLLAFGLETNVSASEVMRGLLVGVHRDAFIALLFTLPLLVWFWIIPNRWFGRSWHRTLLGVGLALFWSVQSFLAAAEYFFFEEFRSRFNTVAVDYLLYPHEVFINIWDSYPVVKVIVLTFGIGAAWTFAALWAFRGIWQQPVPRQSRFRWLLVATGIAGLLSLTVSLTEPRVSRERTLNEIADNGPLSFAAAFWTRNLDFEEFYQTIPRDEAYGRVRKLLAESNATFAGARSDSIVRQMGGDPSRPKLNVVVILEESLGSEFWGCLGRKGPSLTPEMDRLAAQEGMLFTNLYASGNRTVRGLEGVLSSFPPLPGDAIVKRDRSENVETIARVLKRDGYQSLFLYGGRGIFDGMRSFTLRNGYDRFIEQKHFAHPTHTTIWGVCDEDIFTRAVEEFRALHQTGRPFLGTILSVSNHKPFTYPKGRIPEDPDERRRNHAVKYSDYALGQFFRAARREPFWTNTIFAVVADHGARVYGSEKIPIHSYEIPLLLVGPAVISQPTRQPQLGCSLDVAPTILGLLGRPYQTLFFGRDLLHGDPTGERVLMHHNRDIGLFIRDRLVVLGLRKTIQFYHGDPKRDPLVPFTPNAPEDQERERDAMALYQVADDLYTNRRYRLDAESAAPSRHTSIPAPPLPIGGGLPRSVAKAHSQN